MINSEQFLAALAHLPLGSEEILGRSFIAELGVCGDVPQAVNRARILLGHAANQSATFSRGHFASMSNHCVEVFAKKPDSWHFQS